MLQTTDVVIKDSYHIASIDQNNKKYNKKYNASNMNKINKNSHINKNLSNTIKS